MDVPCCMIRVTNVHCVFGIVGTTQPSMLCRLLSPHVLSSVVLLSPLL